MTYESLTDFNLAEPQKSEVTLIPAGVLVKTSISLKAGGYGSGGWLTKNPNSGAIYLSVEFTIIEGIYAKRKIFQKIGIKGTQSTTQGEDLWGKAGISMIRAILESARNIQPNDNSERAQRLRKVEDMGELNGLECIIKIGIEQSKDGKYQAKNKASSIITADHKVYAGLMGSQIITNSNSFTNSSVQPPIKQNWGF